MVVVCPCRYVLAQMASASIFFGMFSHARASSQNVYLDNSSAPATVFTSLLLSACLDLQTLKVQILSGHPLCFDFAIAPKLPFVPVPSRPALPHCPWCPLPAAPTLPSSSHALSCGQRINVRFPAPSRTVQNIITFWTTAPICTVLSTRATRSKALPIASDHGPRC